MERFAKYLKFYSIDFFHFFAKRRKSAEKTPIERKIGVTQRPTKDSEVINKIAFTST